MKKRSIFIGIFVGLPLVLGTLFLILVGYLATHPKFYVELGRSFYYDKDISQNYDLASWCFKKAAEDGSVSGQEWMAFCYSQGKGVPQDFTEAAYWFGKAAEQGIVKGQLNLAKCYAKGEGVKIDFEEAIRYYQKSLDQSYSKTYLYFAWLLATCPEKEHRNGLKAIELAKKAVDLSSKSPQGLGALAAAYAETGQFDLAIEMQNMAISFVDPDDQEVYLERLQSYEGGHPWRENNSD